MSADHHHDHAPATPAWQQPIEAGLSSDQLTELLTTRFGATVDPADRWDRTLLIAREKLVEAVTALRDEPTLRFDQLLDVVGIDYLSFPNHREARFAVVYLFKSTVFRHRLKLKVRVEEDDASVPTLFGLYKFADWLERETWDQYGITFAGHPDLRRILNHHEFVGHPLRKDYPCQKRQKLSVNDPLLEPLETRLRTKGYQILDPGEQHTALPVSFPSAGTAKA